MRDKRGEMLSRNMRSFSYEYEYLHLVYMVCEYQILFKRQL